MQISSSSKKLSLVLVLCIGVMPLTHANADYKIKEPVPTTRFTRIVGTTLLTTAILSYLRLVTKKTAPKRIDPKDDSLKEQIRYLIDELWIGQMEKGERPDKLVINEENPNELVYKYSKIEARGVCGTLYSTLKPVVIPALTLLILLNANTKDVYCGLLKAYEFMDNPFEYFRKLHNNCVDPQPANTNQTVSAKQA